jgi:hypothetical protein
MSRPLRLGFPGASWHVTNCGVEQRDIFLDDRDRRTFVRMLAEAVPPFAGACMRSCSSRSEAAIGPRLASERPSIADDGGDSRSLRSLRSQGFERGQDAGSRIRASGVGATEGSRWQAKAATGSTGGQTPPRSEERAGRAVRSSFAPPGLDSRGDPRSGGGAPLATGYLLMRLRRAPALGRRQSLISEGSSEARRAMGSWGQTFARRATGRGVRPSFVGPWDRGVRPSLVGPRGRGVRPSLVGPRVVGSDLRSSGHGSWGQTFARRATGRGVRPSFVGPWDHGVRPSLVRPTEGPRRPSPLRGNDVGNGKIEIRGEAVRRVKSEG